MSIVKQLLLATAGAALFIFPIIGKAQPSTALTISFENDTDGTKPNGFVSNDSSLVRFSDSIGSDLSVGNFGNESIGKGLITSFDDTSSLIIEFSTPVNFFSLVFGNDEPDITLDGDIAKLDIFNNSEFISTVTVALNRNNNADQTISFSNAIFNRAAFTFSDSGGNSIDLAEIVDNVTFEPSNGGAAVPFELSPGLGSLALGVCGAIAYFKDNKKRKTRAMFSKN